jgi:hypothetical protein
MEDWFRGKLEDGGGWVSGWGRCYEVVGANVNNQLPARRRRFGFSGFLQLRPWPSLFPSSSAAGSPPCIRRYPTHSFLSLPQVKFFRPLPLCLALSFSLVTLNALRPLGELLFVRCVTARHHSRCARTGPQRTAEYGGNQTKYGTGGGPRGQETAIHSCEDCAFDLSCHPGTERLVGNACRGFGGNNGRHVNAFIRHGEDKTAR